MFFRHKTPGQIVNLRKRVKLIQYFKKACHPILYKNIVNFPEYTI